MTATVPTARDSLDTAIKTRHDQGTSIVNRHSGYHQLQLDYDAADCCNLISQLEVF